MSIFDEDQRMLADSVRAMLSKKSDPGAVRTAMASPDRYDRALWTSLAEQIGIGGIAVPEQYDGSGGGPVEAAIVAEELGRVLAPSPFIGSSGVSAALLLAADDESARERLLTGIASGSAVVALCAADSRGTWFGTTPSVAAREGSDRGSTYELSGTAHFVLDAGAATTYLVAAQSSDGIGVYEVDARDSGISLSSGATLDPTRSLYDVEFEGTPARQLTVHDPEAALRHAIAWGTVLLAAEQVGAAARCLELTVEYSKSRVQFGRPIGSFQALKHRMADLYVLVESARAAVYGAASAVDPSTTWYDDASVAAAYCAESFSTVAAECVQLHGGIAITWEHDMQLYFKRAHSSSQLFGSPRVHVAALAGASGL